MRKLFLLSLVLTLMIACRETSPKASVFFENCVCDKIDFSSGIVVADSLGQFSVNVPDSTWTPLKDVDKNYSVIHQGISSENGMVIITVNFSEFTGPWDQQKEESSFKVGKNIIQQGRTDSLRWYVVNEDSLWTTVFVSYVDYEGKFHIATSLSTDDTLSPETRICEIEEVLKTIKPIKRKTPANSV